MAKPTILAVDDDPGASRAIARDLSTRYGADYRVVRATSGAEALDHLARLALQDRPVALVVSDQRMPGMTGIEMLERGAQPVPGRQAAPAHRLRGHRRRDQGDQRHRPRLLPGQAVGPARGAALPGHRRPARRLEQRPPAGDRRRSGWSATGGPSTAYEVKTFLARNHVPYRWLDVEHDDEAHRLARPGRRRRPTSLPLVAHADGRAAGAPSTLELAGALGLRTPGAAAALRPLHRRLRARRGSPRRCTRRPRACDRVVERDAPGGQAGQSAAIENYLGFPQGLSGADLTHRAVAQAARFGAEMVLARDVVGFEARGPVRAVILARRRRDRGPRAARRHGRVLPAARRAGRSPSSPAAASTTARRPPRRASAQGEDVYVIGAANSAGQAVLNFARYAKRVVLLVRGGGLDATMSAYLVQRIRDADNVEVRLNTEVAAVDGAGHLERLTLADRSTGAEEEVDGELAVRVHRRLPAHRLAGRRGRARREGVRRDRPDLHSRGPMHAVPGRRSRWRRACRACSPPATCGWTR